MPRGPQSALYRMQNVFHQFEKSQKFHGCVVDICKTGNLKKIKHFGDKISAKWQLKKLWWLVWLKLTTLWWLRQQKWWLMTQVTARESSKCRKWWPLDYRLSHQLRLGYDQQSGQLRPSYDCQTTSRVISYYKVMTHLVVSYDLVTSLTDDSNLLSTGFFLIAANAVT